jgi:hypothetical protein
LAGDRPVESFCLAKNKLEKLKEYIILGGWEATIPIFEYYKAVYVTRCGYP